MKYTKLLLSLLAIVLLFGCEKEEEFCLPESDISIPANKKAFIAVQYPKNTDKNDFIVVDNKNRELAINENDSVIAEQNTVISLVNKATGKVHYVNYVYNDESQLLLKTNGLHDNLETELCSKSYTLGDVSTSRYIMATMVKSLTSSTVGNQFRHPLYEVYNSKILCKIFSEDNMKEFDKAIKVSLDEGKDILATTLSSTIKIAAQKLTAGIFSDCWDILIKSLKEGEIQFDAHPYEELQVSKGTYHKDRPDLPFVITDFNGTVPNGVILKEHKFIGDKVQVTLDVYNSLSVPFAIRLGKMDDNKNLIPASNDIEYIIQSNGSGIINIIKNGTKCNGFMGHVGDFYYFFESEGTAIRSDQYDRITVEFEMDQENKYIIFEGPDENIRVKAYQTIEILSQMFELLLSYEPDNKGNKTNSKSIETNRENEKKIYFELINEVLGDPESLQLLTTNNADGKKLLKAVGKVIKKYISKSYNNVAKTALSQLLDKPSGKVSSVGKVLEIGELVLNTIDLANTAQYAYFDKSHELSLLALDYELHIPSNALFVPYPANNGTIDLGEDFYIYFKNGIQLGNNTSKNIEIYDFITEQKEETILFSEITVSGDKKKAIFKPDNLQPNTKYFIEIPNELLYDLNTNESFTGITGKYQWVFTTNGHLTTPPTLQSPTNGATNISTNVSQELSWTLATWNDPNKTDPISYKLYFGENSTPSLYQSIPAGNTQPISSIATTPNTTYYWKVAAYDGNTFLTETPVWSFTTAAGGGGNGNYPGATVFVQGGTFSMGSTTGSSNEQPVHSVTLSSFTIGKYEVTNTEYAAFMNAINAPASGSVGGTQYLDVNSGICQISHNGSSFVVDAGKGNYPMIEVTWHGANAYATWVGGRLPTEAEWEYAARGGNQSNGYTYSGSNTVGDVAWYWNNSQNPNNDLYNGKGTHIVGTKNANELGIHDMSGNVLEWCNDWYSSSYYSSSPSSNPTGPATGSRRVLRGGFWKSDASYCRVVLRNSFYPTYSHYRYGFRVVF